MNNILVIILLLIAIVFVGTRFFGLPYTDEAVYPKKEDTNDMMYTFVPDVGLEDLNMQTLVLVGETFTVRVVDTNASRARGLSGTPALLSRDGMLFVFDTDARHGIWMKDMLIPIDILWFDSNKKLIEYREDVVPETYPEVFRPRANARYVLELKAGVRKELRIQQGSVFE